MKKNLLLVIALVFSISAISQTFIDNFESYSPGDYLGNESPDWTTWSGTTGGAEDVTITDNNSSSGTNALYFSSTSANGGPQDVVLPFEEVYNSGNFTFEANFFVESGKGAYFNLQGTLVVAEIWALDCNMLQDGTIKLSNQGTPYLTTTYPVNQWFNLRIEMDLTANIWELFINNTTEGTFANPTGTIGILDLYPVNQTGEGGNGQSGFYVDDVSYNYIPAELPAINGGVTFVNQLGGIAGQNSTVSATVRNLGANEITSFDIAYDYNGSQFQESITGLNLASLETYDFSFDEQVTLVSGSMLLDVTISNVNGAGVDGNPEDDVKSITIDPVTPAGGKMVLGEEATGTWCQWCPRGAVYMDYMENTYPDFWAGVAVHNGDPMTNDTYDAGLGNLISGYPSSVVDRGPDNDPSTLETAFLQKIITPPTAYLMNGATYDSDTRELMVSVTADFQMAASGDWRIGVIITEDGVTGTGSGYNQSNAYSGGGSGEMGGYELLPSPVPASQMVYDHVGRAIAPGFEGLQNSFPSSIDSGSSHVQCFSFTLPVSWNEDEIHIISFLRMPDGTIDNAGKETIPTAVGNGLADCSVSINESVFLGENFTIFPNPTNGLTYIDVNTVEDVNVKIFDFSGKLVGQKDYDVNGSVRLPIATSNLAKGIYLVNLTIGNNTQQQKLIVE